MNRSIVTRACVEEFAPSLEKETAKLLAGVTADPVLWLSLFESELSSATVSGFLISTPQRLIDILGGGFVEQDYHPLYHSSSGVLFRPFSCR